MTARWQVDQQRHLRAETHAVALVTNLRRREALDENDFAALLSKVRGPDARALVWALASLLFEALEVLPDCEAAEEWWASVEERAAGIADAVAK